MLTNLNELEFSIVTLRKMISSYNDISSITKAESILANLEDQKNEIKKEIASLENEKIKYREIQESALFNAAQNQISQLEQIFTSFIKESINAANHELLQLKMIRVETKQCIVSLLKNTMYSIGMKDEAEELEEIHPSFLSKTQLFENLIRILEKTSLNEHLKAALEEKELYEKERDAFNRESMSRTHSFETSYPNSELFREFSLNSSLVSFASSISNDSITNKNRINWDELHEVPLGSYTETFFEENQKKLLSQHSSEHSITKKPEDFTKGK